MSYGNYDHHQHEDRSVHVGLHKPKTKTIINRIYDSNIVIELQLNMNIRLVYGIQESKGHICKAFYIRTGIVYLSNSNDI